MKKQFITRVFLSSLVLALTSLFGGGNLLAQTVDKLTADKFTANSTEYADFSGVKFTSNAVYAGNSAKTNTGAIQLNSSTPKGIVTTASGGKVTKIVLEWESSTTAGRTIDVYGKSSAYESAADLYTSDKGTKIGSITCGTSTTLDVKGDYEYIGLRSSGKALYLTSVEITWASSSDPSKTAPKLKYSEATCNVIIGESYTLPTLSNPYSVAITYSSSDETVAIVDEAGNVNLKGEGTTTIKAYFPGNETYAYGSASYTLTVKKPNVFVYKKVTSAEDLIKGAKYVFVCEGTNKVGSKVSSDKMQSTTATLTNGILEESVGEPMEFVLEIKEGKYYFKSGEKYLKGASGTNLTMVSSTTDEAIKWNILFDEVKGALIWNTYGANNGTGRRLMYRADTYNVFGHYGSAIDNKEYYNVQLYQKVYPLTVSSDTGGYATFYNEEEAYQMPAGLTGYAVTKAENGDYITRTTAYEAGATVPAKTPLLIIGAAADYYPAVVSGDGVTTTYEGSNLLEGARDANGNTQSAKENVYYYKLGLNTKGVPGFYWGADNGAAFKMTKATTAYLAIPQAKANGANALFFDFGGETGINEIQTEQADKAIFDLSGRRVQKATKGFYIVGGKKVLVK